MGTWDIDADAFNAFEAAGWERQVGGYEDFFVPITARLAAPLLDAAGVADATAVLVPPGPPIFRFSADDQLVGLLHQFDDRPPVSARAAPAA